MQITIRGNPKEIAALVLEIQKRQPVVTEIKTPKLGANGNCDDLIEKYVNLLEPKQLCI